MLNPKHPQLIRQGMGRKDRRTFLRYCGAVVGATLAGQVPGWSEPSLSNSGGPSHRVRFGRTPLYVSRLCQGTAFRQISRSPDDPTGQAILHRCLDLGINFFDSSDDYGWGGSEMALGKAVKGRRDQVVICTKVSPYVEPEAGVASKGPLRSAAFTREFVFRRAEESLKRLGTDYLDFYLY